VSAAVQPLDQADAGIIRACYETHVAAMAADDPFEPPLSLARFTVRLLAGPAEPPREVWYMPGEADGAVPAWYQADFPDPENRDRVWFTLTVHPARRRAGLGTALLRHAAQRAAAAGRTILDAGVQEGSAGEAFALWAGATLGKNADVRRVIDVAKVPAGSIARLREAAARAAAGYSLARWTGVTPDDRLDQVASLHNALNDAPMDPGIEATAWTAERVRERMNGRIARSPSRRYSLAAVHDASGEMAALTVVAVDPAFPDWGNQLITAVTRPHRGHRLGMLTKAAMMDWLAGAEPAMRRIMTWNAASNRYMIAVNEELGYEVWGRPYRGAELPVSSVAGQS
jgi:GNAT superfamily N-acetyltransferase/RimJ/RimL family protein N-acetyltransferase